MGEIDDKVAGRLRQVKLLLLDVDGVLTDGGIVYDDKGVETKAFNVRDGHGIKLLKRGGVECGIITSRSSKALIRRCEDLGIELIWQGALKKAKAFEEVLDKTKLGAEDVAFVGDDLVDLPVLAKVGFSVAVADAVEDVRKRVDYVTDADGGRGAVREVCELILKVKGQWEKVTKDYFSAFDRC